jgi:hypothetical protein
MERREAIRNMLLGAAGLALGSKLAQAEAIADRVLTTRAPIAYVAIDGGPWQPNHDGWLTLPSDGEWHYVEWYVTSAQWIGYGMQLKTEPGTRVDLTQLLTFQDGAIGITLGKTVVDGRLIATEPIVRHMTAERERFGSWFIRRITPEGHFVVSVKDAMPSNVMIDKAAWSSRTDEALDQPSDANYKYGRMLWWAWAQS